MSVLGAGALGGGVGWGRVGWRATRAWPQAGCRGILVEAVAAPPRWGPRPIPPCRLISLAWVEQQPQQGPLADGGSEGGISPASSMPASPPCALPSSPGVRPKEGESEKDIEKREKVRCGAGARAQGYVCILQAAIRGGRIVQHVHSRIWGVYVLARGQGGGGGMRVARHIPALCSLGVQGAAWASHAHLRW